MVSHLKSITNKGCKIAEQKKVVFGQIWQGSGGNITSIRRLNNKDQEVKQQGSGGYATRIRRANKVSFYLQIFSQNLTSLAIYGLVMKDC